MVRPVETLCHVPAVCETKNIPYIYVPDASDLSGGKIKQASIMIVKPSDDYKEYYDKVLHDIKKTPLIL